MRAFRHLSAAFLSFVAASALGQGGRFDHASYVIRDADQVIETAPEVESVLATPEGRQMFPKGAKSQAAMRIIRPEKIRLRVVLAELPVPIKTTDELLGPPHEGALRAIGWNPPPRARQIVAVRTQKGRILRAHLQDVLAGPLVKEVAVGGKVTLYALLYYYDKDGPGLIVNEFEKGWH